MNKYALNKLKPGDKIRIKRWGCIEKEMFSDNLVGEIVTIDSVIKLHKEATVIIVKSKGGIYAVSTNQIESI